MKLYKLILSSVLFLSMVGCANNEVVDNEEKVNTVVDTTGSDVQIDSVDDVFVLTAETADELLRRDSSELFKVLNVLDFSNFSDVNHSFESSDTYVNASISNTLLYDVKLVNFSYKINDKYVLFMIDGENSVMANSEETYTLYSPHVGFNYDDLVLDNLYKYEYCVTFGNYRYGIIIDLVNQITEIYRNEVENVIEIIPQPYVPNAGYTIFVWNDNDEYYFDLLPGIEYDGCRGEVWGRLRNSVYDVMHDNGERHNTKHSFYIFSAYSDELDGDVISYVNSVMDYFGYSYAYSDEVEKIEAAKDNYSFLYNYYIGRKGESDGFYDCEYEYCLFGGRNDNFEFHFSDEDIQSISKGNYTIEELDKFIEEHGEYSFYAVGAEAEFTTDEAESLASYFSVLGSKQGKRHFYIITVENQSHEMMGADKPAIYLYPERDTLVHVEIESKGDLLTTYPKYQDGWDVLASSNGNLYDLNTKRNYDYLFWEGQSRTNYDLSKGFIVRREDTVSFLEDKLTYLGLNEDEMNEFIVYWLPQLEKNKYNFIAFQDAIYTNAWKLNVTPAPDTMIRIFMTWYGLDHFVQVDEQELTQGIRDGFTLVEWGGVEIK